MYLTKGSKFLVLEFLFSTLGSSRASARAPEGEQKYLWLA
jgi:hypothetical protein